MRRRPVAWGGRLGVPTSVVGRTAASVFDRYTAASQEREREWLGGRSWAARRGCHTWAKPWPPGADSSAGAGARVRAPGGPPEPRSGGGGSAERLWAPVGRPVDAGCHIPPHTTGGGHADD